MGRQRRLHEFQRLFGGLDDGEHIIESIMLFSYRK